MEMGGGTEKDVEWTKWRMAKLGGKEERNEMG